MLLEKIEAVINSFSEFLGKVTAVLFLLLLLNVFLDVIMRYVFNDVSIGMQEMEWHLFSAIFMLGIPYTLYHEGHVRVDIIYDNLDVRKQALIDLLGTLVLLIPFTLLVVWYGVDFVKESFELGERSGDPGGLPFRWLIKSVVPFAFFTIFLSGIGLMLKSVITLRKQPETVTQQQETPTL